MSHNWSGNVDAEPRPEYPHRPHCSSLDALAPGLDPIGEEECGWQREDQDSQNGFRNPEHLAAESALKGLGQVGIVCQVGVPFGTDLWVDHLEVETAKALLIPIFAGHEAQVTRNVIEGEEEDQPHRVKDDIFGRLREYEQHKEDYRASDWHGCVHKHAQGGPEAIEVLPPPLDFALLVVSVVDQHFQLYVHLLFSPDNVDTVKGEAGQEQHRQQHLRDM
mmetsp:Transcript_31687/g.73493  ORF Transcript_31687/g.73493 Transcript_31687/m.73493 type:complete len:220 (+) Transcript_31687:31-690(+)